MQNGMGANLVYQGSHLPSLLHTQQVPTSSTLSTTSTSSQQPQQKKFRPPLKSPKYIPKPIPLELGNLKTYSKYKFLSFWHNILLFPGNPDILICGNCRELFDDLVDMLDHKKNYCKMRFTCKCEDKDELGCDHECTTRKAITSSPSLSESW